MTLALRDDLFDAQFVRALAYTSQGGADVSECFGTAQRITKPMAICGTTNGSPPHSASSDRRTRARQQVIW